MRETKFRAWFKEEKKMYGVSEIHFSSEGIKYIVCCDLETYDRPYFYVDLKDIELIEHTGLKDKNGVEIYEGDIVKSIYGEIYDVFFASGGYMLSNFENEFNLTDSHTDKLEVIGNVWEHKEVLENE